MKVASANLLRLLQRVLLHGDDAVDREQVADPVRRQCHRHAAIDRAEGLAHLRHGDPGLDAVEDPGLVRDDVPGVSADGVLVLLQLPAGLFRIRRRKSRNIAVVIRDGIVVELDEDGHELGVGPAQEGGVGLYDPPEAGDFAAFITIVLSCIGCVGDSSKLAAGTAPARSAANTAPTARTPVATPPRARSGASILRAASRLQLFMIATVAGMNKGPPGGGPLHVPRADVAYGVAVSVCTTCVVPGVTSDVMPATDL